MRRLRKHPNIVPAIIFAGIPLLLCTADDWIFPVLLAVAGFVVGINL